MTWILAKEFTFEASHQLPNHDGKCARLHGHSWKGIVYVSGDAIHTEGSKQGMVMDYADIKKHLKPLLDDYLDHYHLNESLALETPTSEAVAQWIYNKLKSAIPNIICVRIDETCTSRCLYTELANFSHALLMG